MSSAKIAQNIDTGLWTENLQTGILASAFDDIGGAEFGGRYVLNFGQSGMPAHDGRRYETLGELETAMRRFQPDLRRWNTRMDA